MISTHILDVAQGKPVPMVEVELDIFITDQGWHQVGRGVTNQDGRIADFGEPAAPGLYRLMFDVESYMPDAFFPSITLTIDVRDAQQRYHVPLLLSPFGYTTYRGS
jgi:5-hydroxyisourate hydrolase